MAKAPTKITVETLNHEEATRKNIPTAEHQSLMYEADKNLEYISDVEVV
jgi:adenine-specific DNA-methyltransferase